MNSLKGILCVAIACVTIACAPKQSYTLVWEDDFNAPTLDTAYWNVDDNARGGGNAEMQYYTPATLLSNVIPYRASHASCSMLNARTIAIALPLRHVSIPRTKLPFAMAKSRRVSLSLTLPMACGLHSGCWATTLPPTLATMIPLIRKRSS